MGLGSIKYKGKKFIVKEELGHVRLEINYMDIEDITELKGLDKLKNLWWLHLERTQISRLDNFQKLDSIRDISVGDTPFFEKYK